MSKLLVFALAGAIFFGILFLVFAIEAWLLGIVLSAFEVSITRGQSFAVVILISMLGGAAGRGMAYFNK